MKTACAAAVAASAWLGSFPGATTAQLPVLTEAFRLGELQGEAEALGIVTGVVPLPNERLVIVEPDRVRGQVAMWDVEGRRQIAAFGSRGRGPDEFVFPSHVAKASDSTLLVLDQGNLRVSELTVRGEELVGTHAFRLPFESLGLCVTDGRIFLLGLHEGELIHEVDREGQLMRSFGRPFLGEDALLATVADGKLACSDGASVLFMASHFLPVVRAYTLDGDLLWETELPGFEAVQISRGPNGGIRFSRSPEAERTDQVVSLLTLGNWVVCQFGEVSRDNASTWMEVVEVTTIVLGNADGDVKASSRDLPRLDAVGAAVVVGYEASPFPTLVGYVARD